MIGVEELLTGLDACHRSGGRLGTQMLKYGFLDEHALLEALSEQVNAPSVQGSVLRRSSAELRTLLPYQVSRRLQAVVFKRTDDRFSVAMTNPRAPAVIDEISSYIGRNFSVFVATEIAILDSLSELEDEEGGASHEGNTGAPKKTSHHWMELWAPDKLRPMDLLKAHRRIVDENESLSATFPGLAPMGEDEESVYAGPLDEKGYQALLLEAGERDEVGELLLRRALLTLERCTLFSVHSNRVVGWMARGVGVVIDDVQSLAYPLESQSVFSDVVAADSLSGPMPPGPINEELARILGDPPIDELMIIPIRVKQRTVAFLVGDVPGRSLPEGVAEQLVPAAQKAGVAFEILILRKKILA